jgi:hypothetical protein
MLRMALAHLTEWVDAFGPWFMERKEEQIESQDGRCWDCHRTQRLYLTREGTGAVAVCEECQQIRKGNR